MYLVYSGCEPVEHARPSHKFDEPRMDPMDTILDLLALFPSRGEQTAIVYRSGIRRRSCSYALLHDLSLRMNGLLERKGINPGDRVLLWAPNGLDWVVAFFGCIARGAIVVPVDFMSGEERAAAVADHSGALLAICSRIKGASLRGVETLTVEDVHEILPRCTPLKVIESSTGEDTVELVYTSGTTGSPKGVVLTHRNLLSNLIQVTTHIPVVGPDFVFLSLLPLSHMFEQTGGFLVPLYRGASIVYLRTLKPKAIVDAFKEEEIHAVICVPRLLQLLKATIEREVEGTGLGPVFARLIRFSGHLPLVVRKLLFFPVRLKFGRKFVFFISGGAPLAPELFHFWSALAFRVVEGYGLTECSPVVCANTFEHQVEGAVGRPLPGVEIRLENEEILVKGENVFSRYYRNETATAQTFTGDGWFRTGDLGRIDGEGNLRILGRRKEIIVTGAGINVYPDELEDMVNRISGVSESCVIGLDRGAGEEVHAVLILDGSGIPAEKIIERANEQLDPLHRITGVTVWPEPDFPKTATMKIRKFMVKERIGRGMKSADAPFAADQLIMLIARVMDCPAVNIREDSSFVTELGLTSIGRLELINSLEQEYHVDLEDSAIGPATTVADVRRMLTGREKPAPARKLRLWTNRAPVRMLRRFFDYSFHIPLFRLFVKLETSGCENLLGLEAPVLLIANHSSYLDQPAVMFSLSPDWRYKTATAAWEEFFFSNYRTVAGRIWKRFTYEYGTLFLNLFPISQTAGFRSSLAHMGRIADRSFNILVFPEGARSCDGRLMPFRQGVGIMVSELGVPLVPIRISGMERVLPPGSAWPRRGRVRVAVGAPLFLSTEKPSDIVTAAQRALQDLEP